MSATPKSKASGSAALPRTLASVAGYVDAVGATLLGGLFVSFMSGNTASTGAALGKGQWAEALHLGLPVPLYVLGAVCGSLLLRQSSRHRARATAFLLTAGFLALFGTLARNVPPPQWDRGAWPSPCSSSRWAS